MSTQTLVRKLESKIEGLQRDVSEIKEVILSIVEDREGEYRPEFIRKMLERAREKPIYRYTNRAAFLMQIHAKEK